MMPKEITAVNQPAVPTKHREGVKHPETYTIVTWRNIQMGIYCSINPNNSFVLLINVVSIVCIKQLISLYYLIYPGVKFYLHIGFYML